MLTIAERAAVIPGKSLTRSKAPFGLWATSGSGAEIVGEDGRVYLDMLGALGAVTLGYDRTIAQGVLSLPHVVEVEAAEAVLRHVAPWASRVRFTVTGSEATHAAYRIAKAATGRDLVLMGDWAYHGWHEWCADRGPMLGADGAYASTVRSLQFAHGQTLWAPEPDRIAAVFIEPHRWETLPQGTKWLQDTRAFCTRIGALLVFDSMIYGGRFALGGASEYFGVQPDLECFGKAFGQGIPIAFVAGREALAKHGELVSGTFSGYPHGLQAVVDTIQTYTTQPIIETLWARGRQLQDGLRRVIPSDLGACEGQPAHQRVRFFKEAHGPASMRAMLERGIIWHPGCANVMACHTQEQIDRVIRAAAESVRTL